MNYPDDDFEPLHSRGRTEKHSPFLVNGRPADLQPLAVIDPLRWAGKAVPERRWIVPGLLPEGNVAMLGGDGGQGKTLLAMQLLAACALGKSWLGMEVRRCKVIGIFCEDDPDELHRRMADVLRSYSATFDDLEDMRIVSRVGQENLLMTFDDQWSAGRPSKLYAQLADHLEEHGAQLIVLDSLHDLFAGNENSRTHARQFIGLLRSIAMRASGAVLLTAHPSMSGRNTGTGEAGSTAWNNAVRSRLYLTRRKQDDDDDGDRDARVLRTMKSNYAPSGDEIRLRWSDGVFVRQKQEDPIGFVPIIDLEKRLVDELRLMVQNGALVPADPKAARGFANIVRKTGPCKKYSWSAVIAAQNRMIADGRLKLVELGPASRRRVYVRPAEMILPGEKGGA